MELNFNGTEEEEEDDQLQEQEETPLSRIWKDFEFGMKPPSRFGESDSESIFDMCLENSVASERIKTNIPTMPSCLR